MPSYVDVCLEHVHGERTIMMYRTCTQEGVQPQNLGAYSLKEDEGWSLIVPSS
jgi:hypothetical protein